MNDPVGRATSIQRQAARPDVSVALSASAGSGKTKVLVDRFIRLCVEDTPSFCHPRSILAVTFTRKAAVEIQERLLARAAAMVLADPEDLRLQLRDLFGDRSEGEPNEKELARAAGLYIAETAITGADVAQDQKCGGAMLAPALSHVRAVRLFTHSMKRLAAHQGPYLLIRLTIRGAHPDPFGPAAWPRA